MPTYDYRCTACGARFEAWQKFTDEPIRVCPTCSGPAQRVIHAPAIAFKGSGFYSTDSRASGGARSEAASPAPTESGASDAPAAKADTTGASGKATETPASKAGKTSDAPKPSADSGSSATSPKAAAAPSTN